MTERTCGEHAAFRYTWPGRDEAHVCIECAQKVSGVANAIGLYVQLIPLAFRVGDPIPDPWPTCSQRVTGAKLHSSTEQGKRGE